MIPMKQSPWIKLLGPALLVLAGAGFGGQQVQPQGPFTENGGSGAQERPKGPITENSELGGVPFRIEIPANWNGGLVMFAHAYWPESWWGIVPQFDARAKELPPAARAGAIARFSQAAQSLGYAVACSFFSGGLSVRDGIHDTETLRRYFNAKYGGAYPTIIAGAAQGGVIAFSMIERYPEIYDGALPMTGSAEPLVKIMKEQFFDTRVLFDYYFPGLPGSVVDYPEQVKNSEFVSNKVKELIKTNPELAEKFIRLRNIHDWSGTALESLPRIIAFQIGVLSSVYARAGGNAFDNRNTIYYGLGDNAKLNRELPRYKADPKALEYVRQWATPTGRISDPVVALYSLAEPAVATEYAAPYYEQLTAVAGTSELYVQLFVNRPGHIPYTTDEITEALRRLTDWIKTGKRPAGGEITREGTAQTQRSKP